MPAYYNEIDPYAAQWLRNLIAEGLIPAGDVDERSIVDVRPADLAGYGQCHFFAGLGGWARALRLADVPDSEPIWTGSCPCQPFSAAGKRKGAADERHLWPRWFDLIAQRRPPILFGEQVARAIGKSWLDALAHDLEGEGYAVGAAVLPACSVGAPHIRERLWFVAHADRRRAHQESECVDKCEGALLADGHGPIRHVADADSDERHGRRGILQVGRQRSASEAEDNAAPRRIEWPPEPDLPRVAHGVPARVAKLRALGNAIVPQVAAEFIRAALTT